MQAITGGLSLVRRFRPRSQEQVKQKWAEREKAAKKRKTQSQKKEENGVHESSKVARICEREKKKFIANGRISIWGNVPMDAGTSKKGRFVFSHGDVALCNVPSSLFDENSFTFTQIAQQELICVSHSHSVL
jgi:hypothetical protein